MRHALAATALVAALWCAALGQAEFEVVSIKPAPPDATGRSLNREPGARLKSSNATVKMLILLAYQVMPYQLSGGPGWISSDGFDIEAKAVDGEASPARFRQMIQRLLADRFQLQVHTAMKDQPIYELVVAKNGPKLTAAGEGSETSMRIEGRGRMAGVRATMPMFAATLTKVLQRKVVDRTGLSGAYTFQLRFAPDEAASQPDSDPSLFTAVREQLGLALKGATGPVDVLVIDSAQKPSAN